MSNALDVMKRMAPLLNAAEDHDIQILLLSGFLQQRHPTIDPEPFTDAMSNLLAAGGLPPAVGVELLCCLVDRTSDEENLAKYLKVVARANGKKAEEKKEEPAPVAAAPPEPVPEATEAEKEPEKPAPAPTKRPRTVLAKPALPYIFPLSVPALHKMEGMLKRAEKDRKPIEGFEVGEVIQSYVQRLPAPIETGSSTHPVTAVYVNLVNSEEGPVLDGCLKAGHLTVASAPPGRDLTKPMLLKYGDVTFKLGFAPAS
jgi:hypothetical protein